MWLKVFLCYVAWKLQYIWYFSILIHFVLSHEWSMSPLIGQEESYTEPNKKKTFTKIPKLKQFLGNLRFSFFLRNKSINSQQIIYLFFVKCLWTNDLLSTFSFLRLSLQVFWGHWCRVVWTWVWLTSTGSVCACLSYQDPLLPCGLGSGNDTRYGWVIQIRISYKEI